MLNLYEKVSTSLSNNLFQLSIGWQIEIANAIHQSGRFTIEAPKLFHGKKTEVKQKQINKAIVIKTDQDKTSIKVQMQVGSIQILIEEYK